ncbi:hypothetical protein GF339_09850 [candidate division KSB3 bacterium]|jgi:hypothetical protein|uniref:Uncharacterized protein n=1 Tax=candidate division KSB3 bacterium TaxID=2044937 RepID=A0A9D5JVU8_9BACT|nr:hypothetical protein [candidate division KSB3 bacterium]MBD3324877.1 hypothetical protein [candidate division KSB3 bacterium]
MIDKEVLKHDLSELDRVRCELIMANYRYEEALETFDKKYGDGVGQKAIRILRNRFLLKKLVLPPEALEEVSEELYENMQS